MPKNSTQHLPDAIAPLRFAALIRVSTDAQAKRGESLAVQRRQISDAVARHGGTIAQWYGGQEHATPGWERSEMDRLLTDAQQAKFDAVMVYNHSRWSRDNARSKQDLAILRKAQVRFFVLGSELDFNRAEHRLIQGITTEVNEFFAGVQAESSINTRIARAKNKQPSCGKLPWGREWDKKEKLWKLIPEAKSKIQEIAREYLSTNIGFQGLSTKWGISSQVLHKLLVGQRRKGQEAPDPPVAGPIWIQRFRLKSAGIDEVVETPVPALLDDAMLAEIKKRAENRRTWEHDAPKNTYLFGRKIFDSRTGLALTGMANSKGTRYYRPYKDRKGTSWSVNAESLEKCVLSSLGYALSTDKAFMEAVYEGHQTSDKLVVDLLEQRAIHKKEADKAQEVLDRAVKAVLDGTFTKEEIAPRRDAARASLTKHQADIDAIDQRIDALPKIEELEAERQLMRAWLKNVKKIKRRLMCGLSFDQEMVNHIFGGKDPAGRRYGVYITPHLNGKHRRYEFEAYGRLGTVRSSLRPRDDEFYLGEYAPAEDAATLTQTATGIVKDLGIVAKTTFAKP